MLDEKERGERGRKAIEIEGEREGVYNNNVFSSSSVCDAHEC